MMIETAVVISWFKLQVWIWFVDLNYLFECDWLMELSDNNLARELVEIGFFKPITVEEIVIFMSKQTNIAPFRNKF